MRARSKLYARVMTPVVAMLLSVAPWASGVAGAAPYAITTLPASPNTPLSASKAHAISGSYVGGTSFYAGPPVSYTLATLWTNDTSRTKLHEPASSSTLSSVYGVNSVGTTVGAISSNDAPTEAWLWKDGSGVNLGSLLPGNTTATAINESEQVVGTSDGSVTPSHAFRWENGVMTDLTPVVGDFGATAMDINDGGVAVGSLDARAVKWKANGTKVDLNVPQPSGGDIQSVYTTAQSINNKGDIAGYIAVSETSTFYYQAFKWKNGTATVLPALDSTYFSCIAFGINDSGNVVGECNGFIGSGLTKPVLWKKNGTVKALPSLPGELSSSAHAIDDLGNIAGYSGHSAVVWRK